MQADKHPDIALVTLSLTPRDIPVTDWTINMLHYSLLEKGELTAARMLHVATSVGHLRKTFDPIDPVTHSGDQKHPATIEVGCKVTG
jgi:hypothetical protein